MGKGSRKLWFSIFYFRRRRWHKGKGPIGKFFSEESLKELMKNCNAEIGDSIFLSCGKKNDVEKILSLARNKIAKDLDIVKKINFLFAGLLIILCLN